MTVTIKEEFKHLYPFTSAKAVGKENNSYMVRKNFKFYFVDVNHIEN